MFSLQEDRLAAEDQSYLGDSPIWDKLWTAGQLEEQTVFRFRENVSCSNLVLVVVTGVIAACVSIQPGPLCVDHPVVVLHVLQDPAGVLTPRPGRQVGPECFTANLSVALPPQTVRQSVVRPRVAVVTLAINIVMFQHL